MTTTTEMEVEILSIADIYIDDEFNCRGVFAPIDVKDLAEDIRDNGLHQPVVVMRHNDSEIEATGKTYKLVAGFRRTYAHHILKRDKIPAVVKKHLNPVQALTLNLSENLKRKKLNILQEAGVIQRLKKLGIGQEIMASTVGMSRGWVQARLDLLRLPEDVQQEAASGMITQYQVRELAKHAKDPEAVYAAVRRIKTAKAKGESTKGIVGGRKKPKATSKTHRRPKEITAMIEHIGTQVGMSNITRAMAWCAGAISDVEFCSSLKEQYPDFENPDDLVF